MPPDTDRPTMAHHTIPSAVDGATRRSVIGTAGTGIAATAGCLDDESDGATRSASPVAQTDGPGDSASDWRQDLEGSVPGILVTTDGSTVTAIDQDGVVDEGSDAGSVVQSVFDHVEGLDGPQGAWIHFPRGRYPWDSQATTGATGIHITGEWTATRLVATSDIDAFVRFSSQDASNIQRGPKIRSLEVDGKERADHFVSFDAVDETNVEQVYGQNFGKSLIYARPVGDRENVDNARFRDLRVINGSLGIFEGAAGKPADVKIETCAVNQPNEYGLILRNVTRFEVNRFYTGVGGENTCKGSVLLDNTAQPEWQGGAPPHTQQCRFVMIEHENFGATPDSAAVHIRAAEGAGSVSRNHQVIFPRGHAGDQERTLKVEAERQGLIHDVELIGSQHEPPHPRAIELINAQDCRIHLAQNREDPRYGIVDENGVRNTVNDVGTNAGNPAETGEWSGEPYEGVTVVDTEGGGLYRYGNGQWWRIGEAQG
jgi:hypothetical protein